MRVGRPEKTTAAADGSRHRHRHRPGGCPPGDDDDGLTALMEEVAMELIDVDSYEGAPSDPDDQRR
jgi:hypothetical protein